MDLNLANLIRGRRTIASFQAEVPSSELIEAAIEIARWAPNHKKTEPWRVYSLGTQAIREIVDLNSRLVEVKKGIVDANAKRRSWSAIPGWLAVTCSQTNDAFRQEEDYAACCCFIQNLMLGLWSSGIGTKWSTGDVTRESDFYQILRVNRETERVIGLIWYGYPTVIPEQTRKPVSDFLVRLP